jgi:tetratricopeptide (TPR) repeat protein
MAIKGSLKEASLPDVLQLLALGKKTGCLSVTDRTNLGNIYFDNGRICYASIVNRRDRLGDMLVKGGKITHEQLEQAIERQTRERQSKLGRLLLESGAITEADLERCVRIQVEEAVYYLFTWTQGSFRFDADVKPEGEDAILSINPESLLLEGARRVDEWSLIEKKVHSFDCVFAVEEVRLSAADVELTPEQELIVTFLNGERDVTELMEESGLGEFDTAKALYGLISAGFVHRTSAPSRARPSQPVAATRIKEHCNLGVAFYRTGMLEEATREFRRAVELKSDEASAHFYLGLVATKQDDWSEAHRAFQRTVDMGGPQPTALHNLALSLEKLGRLDEAEATFGDATHRARRDPRILTGWAIAAMRQDKFAVAEGRLDRAREVAEPNDLPAVWYWARSIVAAVGEDYETAQSVLRDGVERHPSHPVLRNNLAVILEIMGEADQAEKMLRAAHADGLMLPQLSKNLGDVLYRAGHYDEAWDAYQQAVKLHTELGDDTYFKLGNIAYKRFDHATASAMWHKTLQLNPNHQLARTNIDTMSALR